MDQRARSPRVHFPRYRDYGIKAWEHRDPIRAVRADRYDKTAVNAPSSPALTRAQTTTQRQAASEPQKRLDESSKRDRQKYGYFLP